MLQFIVTKKSSKLAREATLMFRYIFMNVDFILRKQIVYIDCLKNPQSLSEAKILFDKIIRVSRRKIVQFKLKIHMIGLRQSFKIVFEYHSPTNSRKIIDFKIGLTPSSYLFIVIEVGLFRNFLRNIP